MLRNYFPRQVAEPVGQQNLQITSSLTDTGDTAGWVTTSYNGWPSLNLQESEIPQQFGDPEAWEQWILSHFDENEKEDVQAIIDAYLSRPVAAPQLLQEIEIPQQFGDPDAWREWILSHFDENEKEDVQAIIDAYLSRPVAAPQLL